ncbi:nicotinamide N-methyltransferase Nnt1 [Histoplasma capsulatum var. duboisii H88]|uniref:Protein N-terminal and lysine N-methyltransferase EFM7 n=1 Tax=Ajellomyces capsulatus (strain H88) TaxID=544711 RepID=F0UPJ4_AJEC8|nr:nicotinamide N-methyltransferase Nnt1 [Histoplasma capsulatum var. duboisii H88]QSS53947.1 nicotinamide N-methyltransferase Nnt1 [Histoplasma capsulatum var. duboisii H88]
MDSTSDNGADNEFRNLFQEPEGFLPPSKKPTFEEYAMRSGPTLKLRLVGNHPLWGFLLWNAGKTSADYLEDRAREWVEKKDVLELGAGAGLPSLVCAILGARTVVVTDYPDPDLVENMRINAQACESLLPLGGTGQGGQLPSKSSLPPLRVEGFKWGADPEVVLRHLPPEDAGRGADGRRGFDLLILADVIYNHPQHGQLITSVKQTLKRTRDAVAFVVFTPYQPWLFEKIVAFFPRAEESGFVVTKLFERLVERVMFEEDPGDETLRRTVFGYELRWKDEELGK